MRFTDLLRAVGSVFYTASRSPVWQPPATAAKEDEWDAIVRNGYAPLPWHCTTQHYKDRRWLLNSEGDKRDLRRFVRVLAGEIPEAWWPVTVSIEAEPVQFLCCDIRLRNFTLVSFSQPAVIEAIKSLVQSTLEVARERKSRFREPGKFDEIGFKYQTVRGVTFGAAWYPYSDWISWPDSDILQPVPELLNRDQLAHIIDSAAKAAVALLPEIPLLPESPPEIAGRGRPSAPRRLDSPRYADAYREQRSLVDLAARLPRTLMQGMLDQVIGHAHADFVSNQEMVEHLTAAANALGMHLFLETDSGLVEVRVLAKPVRTHGKSSPTAPAARAGLFAVSTYQPEKGRTSSLNSFALFPPLIAARDLAEAEMVRTERGPNPKAAGSPEEE